MTLKRSEWLKTPYAKSQARDPDSAIQNLLHRYGVVDIQWTTGSGPNKRPGCLLRFVLKGRTYRIMLEALEADADREELLKQVKRAIFHYLKAVLEVSTVFVSAEEALFAFLELPGQVTTFEVAKPNMEKLTSDGFRLMLPAPK